MNNEQEIKTAIKEFILKYGTTITYLPGRFRQKVLDRIKMPSNDVIDDIFSPLEKDLLNPLRSRANSYITLEELEETISDVFEKTHLQNNAKSVVYTWVEFFNVEVRSEKDSSGLFDSTDELTIESPEDLKIDHQQHEVTEPNEAFINPFDTETIVEEPIVEDFQVSFDDSFEKISEPYNQSDQTSKHEISSKKELKSITPEVKTKKTKLSFEKKAGDLNKHQASINLGLKSNDYQPQSNTSNMPANYNNKNSDLSIAKSFEQLHKNNTAKALDIMKNLAQSGNIRAQFHLGEFYMNGVGISEKDPARAEYWLRKAANRGSAPATKVLMDLEVQKSLDESSAMSGCGCIVAIVVFLYVISAVF